MSVRVETKDAAFVAHAPESLFSLTGIRSVPGLPNYDVAPDGQRFLFAKPVGGATNDEGGSIPSRIIVVQNWTEELKRRVPVN